MRGNAFFATDKLYPTGYGHHSDRVAPPPTPEMEWRCKMKSSERGISRRGFIGSSALILGSVLFPPVSAMGDQFDAPPATEIEGGSEAQARWNQAVARAHNEGLPVYYGLEGAGNTAVCTPNALGSVRTVNASKQTALDTVMTLVTISANYGATTANKISPFNWAKIYNNILDVEESYYDRAILDGGRTNAIYFHAVFTSPKLGIGHLVSSFYAEFYHTFVGRVF